MTLHVQQPSSNGTGSVPSGSGFAHITGGTQDAAARAINLASSDVTGVLPAANQAQQTVGGTTPISGAATYQVFVASSPTASGFYNISGDLAAALAPGYFQVQALGYSSAIPVTGPGFLFAAAQAAPKIGQTATAVSSATGAALTIAAQSATGTTSTGGALNLSSGAGTTAAGLLNLQAGGTTIASVTANGLSIPSTTSAIQIGGANVLGDISVPYVAGATHRVLASTYGTAAGVDIIDINSSNGIVAFGGYAANSGPSISWLHGYTNAELIVNGVAIVNATASSVAVSKPIIGDSSSSPYGVHGVATVSMTASRAATAAEYAMGLLIMSSSAGGMTLTMPAPASLAAGYWKCISNAGGNAITLSTGTGTTVSVAAGTTKAWYWFDSTGVR